jgi:D-amino-acid dehydrogenase
VTDKGRLPADAIVVALGAYTPALLRPLGLHVPVYPVKGISITAPRGAWSGAPHMAVLDDSRKCALVPIGDRLRVAGSAEITGFNTTPAPARLKAMLERVYEIFPGFRAVAEGPDAVAWAGLRPVVPSGRPIIGPTAIEGLYLNSGHGHTGWTMAAGSGRRLAAALAGAAGKTHRAAA